MQRPPDGEQGGNDAAWLAGAVLLALGLRAAFFSSFTGYDEFAYARIAGDIARGAYHFRDLTGYYGFRYLLVFPAAFFIEIIGRGGALAWPLACSLCNVLLAFFLAREFFGRRAGLFAAFFQACLPVSVIYGTMLYPDEVLVFCTGLAALMFLQGAKAGGKWGGAGQFALAGLFAGLGWHIRLNSAVMLPLFAVWALATGPRRAHFALAAGFLAALLPDLAAGAALAGDPLFSLKAQLLKLAADAAVYPGGHLVYLRGLLGLDLYGLALFGFSFYFFCASVVYAARRKEFGRMWLPLTWFGLLLAYLEFGPSSLSPYHPVHKQLRFLSMAFFPIVAAAGYLVSSVPASLRAALAGFLIATSVLASWKMHAYRVAEAAPHRAAAAYLSAKAPAVVYASGAWGHFLSYYLRDQAPYYRPEGAPYGLVKPLALVLPAPSLSGACAVLGGEDGRPDEPPAAEQRFLKGGAEKTDLPGGGRIYCLK